MQNLSLTQVAEISINYKSHPRQSERPKILSSQDSYIILLENWSEQIELREEFKVILLNRANRVLGIVPISTGGVSSCIVDAKLVFGAALKACASAMVLAHNHPSGNLNPSGADLRLTKKLRSAGDLLDITVLDHLIITPLSYYSFADEGNL